MFAPNPQLHMIEMLRVTKPGGRIAFSTWPFEIVNGKLVKAMAKHMLANTTTFSIYSSNQSEPQKQIPPSPIQGVNPKTIQKLLLNGLNKDAIIDIRSLA